MAVCLRRHGNSEPDLASARQYPSEVNRVHEIRNPLNAISLATQMMAAEINNRNLPCESYCDIISRNVHRIESMLKEILNPGSSEPVVYSRIRLADVITQSLSLVDDRIKMNGIRVFRNVDKDINLDANAEQLILVLINIFTNAIEAVHGSEGTIWVTAYRSAGEVKLIVKDNGEGMSAETKQQLGNPDFTTKATGLGRGMANVKAILLAHGAGFAVHSEVGSGTTLVITFPNSR